MNRKEQKAIFKQELTEWQKATIKKIDTRIGSGYILARCLADYDNKTKLWILTCPFCNQVIAQAQNYEDLKVINIHEC